MYTTECKGKQYVFSNDRLTVNGIPIPYIEMSNIAHRQGDSPAFLFDFRGKRFALPYNPAEIKQVLPYFLYAQKLQAAKAGQSQQAVAQRVAPATKAEAEAYVPIKPAGATAANAATASAATAPAPETPAVTPDPYAAPAAAKRFETQEIFFEPEPGPDQYAAQQAYTAPPAAPEPEAREVSFVPEPAPEQYVAPEPAAEQPYVDYGTGSAESSVAYGTGSAEPSIEHETRSAEPYVAPVAASIAASRAAVAAAKAYGSDSDVAEPYSSDAAYNPNAAESCDPDVIYASDATESYDPEAPYDPNATESFDPEAAYDPNAAESYDPDVTEAYIDPNAVDPYAIDPNTTDPDTVNPDFPSPQGESDPLMSSNEEPPQGFWTKGKIIGIIIAVVVIAAVLFFVFGHKSGDKDAAKDPAMSQDIEAESDLIDEEEEDYEDDAEVLAAANNETFEATKGFTVTDADGTINAKLLKAYIGDDALNKLKEMGENPDDFVEEDGAYKTVVYEYEVEATKGKIIGDPVTGDPYLSDKRTELEDWWCYSLEANEDVDLTAGDLDIDTGKKATVYCVYGFPKDLTDYYEMVYADLQDTIIWVHYDLK